MNKTIKDPNELLQCPQSVLVIDLLEHAMNLTHKQLKALVAPPKGIYLKGAIRPIVKEGKVYYPKSKAFRDEYAITDLDQIFCKKKDGDGIEKTYTSKEDIVDESGNVVISAKNLQLRANYLTREPDLPITGIDVALTLVLNYLGNLSPYTRFVKTNSLENLIKPEHYHLIEEDEYETAFENLLNAVFDFVNHDVWFIYFHRVQGSTIIIEKMIDYRIYRYHELIWEEEQNKLDPYAD